MNPQLVPVTRIREMSNAELVAFAKEHSYLSILEQEFVKRFDEMDRQRVTDMVLGLNGPDRDVKVKTIVEWAKQRMEKGK